jgi:hypothetical protein
MFLALRMIPVFNAISCSKKGEAGVLPKRASGFKVLRKEWEMATADPPSDRFVTCRTHQGGRRTSKRMKVVPQEVVYIPKFTYI